MRKLERFSLLVILLTIVTASRSSSSSCSSPLFKGLATWLNLRGGQDETSADAVIDVSSSTFLSEVLQSKVPVLVDVYAEWCGPCQQIKPILEETAKAAHGQFKLAKINADLNQDLMEVLNVTALPTLFAFNEAFVTDRSVGGVSDDQLQGFIDRLVTGHGATMQRQVTKAGFSTEYSELTEKVREFAQFFSLSFSKKERLSKMVDAALDLGGVVDDDRLQNEALKTTLIYLKNAAKDIRNSKYRIIKTSSKAFKDILSKSEACLQLLVVAGFKRKEGGVSSSFEPFYELCHENKAILNLVVQRAEDTVNRKKWFSS